MLASGNVNEQGVVTDIGSLYEDGGHNRLRMVHDSGPTYAERDRLITTFRWHVPDQDHPGLIEQFGDWNGFRNTLMAVFCTGGRHSCLLPGVKTAMGGLTCRNRLACESHPSTQLQPQ